MKAKRIIPSFIITLSMITSLLTPLGDIIPNSTIRAKAAYDSLPTGVTPRSRTGMTLDSNSKVAWNTNDVSEIIGKELDTHDKILTSKIGYQTIGLTITRCELGTKNPIKQDWIALEYNPDSIQDVIQGDGTSRSYFGFSMENIMNIIGSYSADWLSDIKSGELCYVKVDSVMITVNYNFKDENSQDSGGAFCGPGHALFEFINSSNDKPAVYDNVGVGKSPDDLIHAYGWASPKSIRTHFDRYILFAGEEDVEPTVFPSDPDDGFFKRTGKTDPHYYTWNTSDNSGEAVDGPFHLDKGIPSGENITNGVGSDTWFGNYEVRWHKGEKDFINRFKFSVDYSWKDWEQDHDPITREPIGEPYEVTRHGTYPEDEEDRIKIWSDIKRAYKYYYISNINMYEIADIAVCNDVYPGDWISYSYPGNSIPMDAQINGIANPKEKDSWLTTIDQHVKWPERNEEWQNKSASVPKQDSESEAKAMAAEKFDELVEKWYNIVHDDVITEDDPVKGVASWNDYLKLDNVLYMNGVTGYTPVTQTTTYSDGRKIYYGVNTTEEADSDAKAAQNSCKDLPNGEDDGLWKFKESKETVLIPREVANGAYPTSMQATFIKRILDNSTGKTFSEAPISQHIKPGFGKNEPVYIHTPVVGPVTILDADTGTQLITENLTSDTEIVNKDGTTTDGKVISELILDHTYTFRFDPARHRAIQGYSPNGEERMYNKYVLAKWVRFPFHVGIYKDDGSLKFFQPIEDKDHEYNGVYYTDWIECNFNPDNDSGHNTDYDEMTKFYIPPFAEEKNYWEIQYMVLSSNVYDEHGVNHISAQEAYHNVLWNAGASGVNYVATYKVPVEVSGIIYDFQVIGTNSYQDFSDEYYDDSAVSVKGDIAFSPRKEEKKQGNKNRLGGTSVRYNLDGKTTRLWKDSNTLPMGLGSSKIWSNAGYLKAGTFFTYSVKTIANLWDETGDWVNIFPTFRYYDIDGTEHKNIQVYYPNPDGDGLIRYGSAWDIQSLKGADMGTGLQKTPDHRTFTFWNEQMAGMLWDTSYTTDKNEAQFLTTDLNYYKNKTADPNFYHNPDFRYTIGRHNYLKNGDSTITDADITEFFTRKVAFGVMSQQKLTSQMRTLTGNYEELEFNIDDDQGKLSVPEFSINNPDTKEKMKYCMQTWYGTYYIPYGILVCDSDTFKNLGATDQDGDGVIDYYDYLLQFNNGTDNAGNPVKGVDKEADFWLNTPKKFPYGFLLLNFKITTTNNNNPHLQYYGGTKDMWQVQGAKNTAPMGDKMITDKYPIKDIPLQSGDIAFIQPNEKNREYFTQSITPN